MAKIEVEESHYFASILALEHMIKRRLEEQQIPSEKFGIVMAIKNKGEVETYLINFDLDKHYITRIENNKFPNGKLLIPLDNKEDAVTQAALHGIEIVDNPFEVTK